MECNRDEAMRARAIAEQKMQAGDYAGARRIALKARSLYPELENVSQLVTVCDVHCSAQLKIRGVEMDWYGILQVEKFSDEATIKKQFRKLALSLHPDKNKFPGAEAAFKLIGEAQRFLTDPSKRSLYDIRCKGFKPFLSKSSACKTKANSSHQWGKKSTTSQPQAPSSGSYPSSPRQQPATFFAMCTFCKVRFHFYREYVGALLRCQHCHMNFVAHDLGPWMNNGANHGNPYPAAQNDGHDRVNVSFQTGNFKTGSMPNFGESTTGANTKCDDTLKGNSAAGQSASISVGSGNNVSAHNIFKQHGMPKVDESTTEMKQSEPRNRKSSTDVDFDAGGKGSECGQSKCSNGENASRKSGRKKRQVSYAETDHDEIEITNKKHKRSDDFTTDDDDSKIKIPEGDIKSKVVEGTVEDSKHHIVFGLKAKGRQVDHVSGLKAKARENEQGSGVEQHATEDEQVCGSKEDARQHEEGSDLKEKVVLDEEVSDSKNRTSQDEHEPEKSQPESDYKYPEPEFYDFDKCRDKELFEVDQVWACYDPLDGMPRFYALIKKVDSAHFRLTINWLESRPATHVERTWANAELPIACGKYSLGDCQVVEDHLMFSHQVTVAISGRNYVVFPRKGETWAIFKNWDIKWGSNPAAHQPPYNLEYVEILSDFNEKSGVEVACLRKVEGFNSVFRRATLAEAPPFRIPKSEIFRFSHAILSIRMDGGVAPGILEGFLELDTASLPESLFDNDVKQCNEHEVVVEKCDGNGSNESEYGRYDEKGGNVPEIDGKKCDENVSNERGGNMPEVSGKKCDDKGSKEPEAGDKKRDENCSNLPDVSKKTSSDAKSTEKGENGFGRVQQKWKNNSQPVSSDRKSLRHSTSRNPQMSTSTMADANTTYNVENRIESSSANGRIVVEVKHHDFSKERSEDKFQEGQVWALYSKKDNLPREFAVIKRVSNVANFKLYVAMLKPCFSKEDTSKPTCSGSYQVDNADTRELVPSTFSHLVKAETISKNFYSIIPRKGEVWAMYKQAGLPDGSSSSHLEFNYVEVLEGSAYKARIALLEQLGGGTASFYRVGKADVVDDISVADFSRFSHQCCAIQHNGDDAKLLKGCWEIDPASRTSYVILLL